MLTAGMMRSLDVSDITIAAWIYPTNWEHTTYPGIVVKRTTYPTLDWELYYDATSDRILFLVEGGDNPLFHSLNLNPALNQWHFLTVTKEGTNYSLYHNGVYQGSETGSSTLPTGDKLVIGALQAGGGDPFKGTIDEVRISATARSGDWIKTSYNNQNNPLTFYTVGAQQDAGPVPPVPDLPAIILFGAGLLVIVYAVARGCSRR